MQFSLLKVKMHNFDSAPPWKHGVFIFLIKYNFFIVLSTTKNRAQGGREGCQQRIFREITKNGFGRVAHHEVGLHAASVFPQKCS